MDEQEHRAFTARWRRDAGSLAQVALINICDLAVREYPAGASAMRRAACLMVDAMLGGNLADGVAASIVDMALREARQRRGARTEGL